MVIGEIGGRMEHVHHDVVEVYKRSSVTVTILHQLMVERNVQDLVKWSTHAIYTDVQDGPIGVSGEDVHYHVMVV